MDRDNSIEMKQSQYNPSNKILYNVKADELVSSWTRPAKY